MSTAPPSTSVDGIYRIATFLPDAGITFNQFLIDDERPALVRALRERPFAYDGRLFGRDVVGAPDEAIPGVGAPPDEVLGS